MVALARLPSLRRVSTHGWFFVDTEMRRYNAGDDLVDGAQRMTLVPASITLDALVLRIAAAPGVFLIDLEALGYLI